MARAAGNRPSLDGSRPQGGSHSQTQREKSPSNVRNALRRAKKTQCPNAYTPLHAYSTSSGRAYEIPCGSWSCSFCGWKKQRVAEYLALAGMVSAHNRGERLRFITLTEDPKNPLDVPKLSACWNRLRTTLTRSGVLDQYCSVVETTSKQRPHMHLVATGSYIPQWKLAKLAQGAGFGRVVDIRAVDMDPESQSTGAAGYIAKELSAYVSKQKKGDALGRLVAKRRRPMRTSRGWYPGGMKRAEKELLALCSFDDEKRDKGPWWFVIGDAGSTLTIRGTDEATGEAFEVKDIGHRSEQAHAQGKGGGAGFSQATTTAALGAASEAEEAA